MMSNLESFIKLSQGNPGALECIAMLCDSKQDLVQGTNLAKRTEILQFIDKYNLLGSDLYVFYADLCNKNLDVMHYIVANAPVGEIRQAASARDGSGIKIILPYLQAYNASR